MGLFPPVVHASIWVGPSNPSYELAVRSTYKPYWSTNSGVHLSLFIAWSLYDFISADSNSSENLPINHHPTSASQGRFRLACTRSCVYVKLIPHDWGWVGEPIDSWLLLHSCRATLLASLTTLSKRIILLQFQLSCKPRKNIIFVRLQDFF